MKKIRTNRESKPSRPQTAHPVLAAALALALGGGGAAHAQTGVSDDRVSLPEGPGSLEGIGDDVEVNANMGAFGTSVPIRLPITFEALQPDLGLRYSSASGASVVGMGWSIPEHSIERLTLRGVPRYDADDEFEVDRGDQLVHVETLGDGSQVYRARFEGGWVRYTWHDVGDGSDGYWTAERPNGGVDYYGVDASGQLVDDARLGPDGATFRYLLVESTDARGHRVRYDYEAFGASTHLTSVSYGFDGDTPRHRVELDYEDRDDWISDATGGFEEVVTQRLAELAVMTNGTTVRRYELRYESYADSGGFSRLAEVQMYGLADETYPASFTFAYSTALGELCDGSTCERPYVVDMGDIGLDLQSGRTQLVDINGDALPDIVSATPDEAAHRFFLNEMGWNGDGALVHGFGAPYASAVGTYAGHNLASAYVKVMDVNADRYTDVVSADAGMVLLNFGAGDWSESVALGGDLGGLDGIGEAGLRDLRFIDYDNDRDIDLIRSTGSGEGNVTTVYENTRDGFVAVTVEPVGAGFDSDAIELNDINGDGMLDVVVVQTTGIRYRVNLGRGIWTDWRNAAIGGGFDLSAAQAASAELEDLNGDGLSDLVLVEGDEVRVWINRNGAQFEALDTVASDHVDGEIPERLGTTTVLFADMNGNGSSDIVWITRGGEVTYLELFPVRPNLLSRVENGLGAVTDVAYGTSVEHMIRDGGPDAWEHRLPFASAVVDEVVRWDRFSDVESVTTFAYHDGFYDGVEKMFRGFAEVEQQLAGDELQEAAETYHRFDVGDGGRPQHAGELVYDEVRGEETSLRVTENRYDDCEVAGVSQRGLRFAVVASCLVETRIEHREGAAEGDWLTTRTTISYDGCGNVELSENEGVVGEDGDESYVETTWVTPDTASAWLNGLPVRERTYGVAGAPSAGGVYRETVTYYDGDDFVGLPEGEATRGFAARTVARVDDDTTITTGRFAADAHGNVVERIGPRGTVGGSFDRMSYTMDAEGLRVIAQSASLEDGEGAYTLRRELRYDDLFGQPTLATVWATSEDGTLPSNTPGALRTYDAFGNMASLVNPGDDTVASPTAVFEYDISEGLSALRTRTRSEAGGALDLEVVRCVDGRGRQIQERTRLDEGRYLVNGFTIYNVQGREREVFQPYTSDTGDCVDDRPDDLLSFRTRYDALGRPTETLTADGDGGWWRSHQDYLPLGYATYDRNDSDPSHPHYDTPTVTQTDGLGRIVAVGRTPEAGGEPEWFVMSYSALGDLARVVDPEGNVRTQEHDALGRIVATHDGDRGRTEYAYDDGGNLVSEVPATGVAITRTYDALSRTVSEVGDDGTSVSYVWDRPASCPAALCSATAARLVEVHYEVFGEPAADWFGYDARGNRVLEQRNLPEFALTTRYAFDNVDRRVATTYPGDHTVEMTYDGGDGITSVPGYIDAIERDARGDAAMFRFAGGVERTLSHGADRRLDGIRVVDPDGAVISALGYVRDREGLVREVTDSLAGDGLPSNEAVLRYDALDRLIGATLDPSSGALAETISYAFDGADVLTARSSDWDADSPVHDGVRRIDPDRPHATLEAGGVTYAYDEAGFVVERNGMDLWWDALGRLVAVTDGADERVAHAYAGGEDRVATRAGGSHTWYGPDGFEIVDGIGAVYIRAGFESVARHEVADTATIVLRDVAPALEGERVWVAGGDDRIDAGDAWVAYAHEQGFAVLDVEPSASAAVLESSAARGLLGARERVTLLHRDAVDSLIAVTEVDGTVRERITRYPFGAERSSTANVSEAYGFTDKATDAETGLVFFGSRFYDPVLGRWMTPDPLFATLEAGSVAIIWEALGNYQYGWNSPHNGQDEDGNLWDGRNYGLAVEVVRATAGQNRGTYPTVHVGNGTEMLINQLRAGFYFEAGSRLRESANIYRFVNENRDRLQSEITARTAPTVAADARGQARSDLQALAQALDPAASGVALLDALRHDLNQIGGVGEYRTKANMLSAVREDYVAATQAAGQRPSRAGLSMITRAARDARQEFNAPTSFGQGFSDGVSRGIDHLTRAFRRNRSND